MLHLPKNIRLIRLISRKTQTEFGEQFGASKAMIVSYEKGKASPDELFISRLSEMVGVSEKDLLNKLLKETDVKVEKLEKGVPHEIRGNYIRVGTSNLR